MSSVFQTPITLSKRAKSKEPAQVTLINLTDAKSNNLPYIVSNKFSLETVLWIIYV